MIRDEDQHGLQRKRTAPIECKVELGKPTEFGSGIGSLRVNDVNDDAVQILCNVTLI